MLRARGGGADSRTKEGNNPERCDYLDFGLTASFETRRVTKRYMGVDQRKISLE